MKERERKKTDREGKKEKLREMERARMRKGVQNVDRNSANDL